MENGNEPAFGGYKYVDSEHALLDPVKVRVNGLSKREYFAALAMQSYVAHYHGSGTKTTEYIVEMSIKTADALLEGLNKSKIKK